VTGSIAWQRALKLLFALVIADESCSCWRSTVFVDPRWEPVRRGRNAANDAYRLFFPTLTSTTTPTPTRTSTPSPFPTPLPLPLPLRLPRPHIAIGVRISHIDLVFSFCFNEIAKTIHDNGRKQLFIAKLQVPSAKMPYRLLFTFTSENVSSTLHIYFLPTVV
jgi:hypothetical protein